MIDTINVYLWGRKVGTLASSPDNNNVCFYYDAAYVKDGYEIAPLVAPLGGVKAQRGLPFYPEKDKLFDGLPSFIADSLPDHWGNTVFNEWAKRNNIHVRNLSPIDRLAYIGKRGMGALEFLPSIAGEMESPFKVVIAELYNLSLEALDDAKGFGASMSSDILIESLFKVGTSAGGKRPKAIINVDWQTKRCYSGQVPSPEPDFVPMIIKFDEHCDMPTTRIEYSYYLMAKDAGMNMTGCYLLEGNCQTHFLTERFDRNGNDKIHIQTLAAMNPDADSYEDLMEVAFRIGLSSTEKRQLFMQMVMNVVCGNVDDHTKNFSFLMSVDGVWHAAPAYDFTFTVDPNGWQMFNKHSITVCNKTEHIQTADMMEIAKRYNIKSASSIIDSVKTVAANYRKYGEQSGVNDKWITIIEKEISSRISE